MHRLERRFWKWVHDTAERVWHWTYYRKLADPAAPARGDITYAFQYITREDIAAHGGPGTPGWAPTAPDQLKMLGDPRPYKLYGSTPGGTLHELDTKSDTKTMPPRNSFIPKRDRW